MCVNIRGVAVVNRRLVVSLGNPVHWGTCQLDPAKVQI